MIKSHFASALALTLSLAATPALAAAPAIANYGELPHIVDFALSPDGTRLASVRAFNGENWLIVTDVAQKNVLLRASAGTTKVRGVSWADAHTVLVTNSETVGLGPGFTASKYELRGTIIVPLDGKGQSGLVFGRTKSIANTTRGSFGMRRLEGKTIGFYGGIALDTSSFSGPQFTHGRPTLYAVDMAQNTAHAVARPAGENHWRDWLVDGQGEVAATLDVNEQNGDWRIENAHGQAIARGNDPVNGASLVCFGKDGTSVIYAFTDEDGRSRWFEVGLDGGTASEILANVNVERLYIDHANGRMLGYRKSGERPETVMSDPVTQSKLGMIFRAFPGRNVRLIDWTANFDKVLLRTDGNRDSGTWFYVDVTNRRADPVADEHPGIAADAVGPISSIDYTAQDGLKLDGVLTLPPGRAAKNLPIVVLPHGGPHASDEVGFDWWAQAFAARGYAVFQPNFRGSTGRSDALRNAGNGEWGRKMQTDISDGLAELVKRGIADPARACIVGASYGGYAALAGVTLQHGFYRCAVSVAGVADVNLMYQTDIYESGGKNMTRNSLREDLGDPGKFDEISPRKHADQADAPILLIHGKDDTVVPFKQSLLMADALKDAHKPYEMVVLKEEDHWLSRAATRTQMLEAAVAFVEKYDPAS